MFGVGSVKDWRAEVYRELGKVEVDQKIALARNCGAQVRHSIGADDYNELAKGMEERHGRPAMISAAKRFNKAKR
jgi:hypothetical protein